MAEFIEHKGDWFFPSKKDTIFHGTLKLGADNNIVLELICTIQEIIDIFYPGQKEVTINKTLITNIILGNTFDGEITLLKCYGFIKRLTPGPLLVLFYPDIVFRDVHFYDDSKIFFKKVKFNLKNLYEWVNIHGFKVLNYYDEKEGPDIVLSYKTPDPIMLYENNDYKIYIDFHLDTPTRSKVQKEMKIRQNIFVTIELLKDIPFDSLLKIVYSFQNFLFIAMMAPTYIISMDGESESKLYEVNGKKYRGNIKILLKPSEYLKKEIDLIPHDMLFTIHDVRNEITNYLSNWFENYDKLKPAYDLYFRALYFYDIYLKEQLINLVVAIEAFHSMITGRNEDYKYRIKNIMDQMPEDFKINFLGNKKERGCFAKGIVIIRNNIVHPKKDIEDLIPLTEILAIRNKLIILIMIIIMVNMGLPYKFIYKILKRKSLIKA